MITIDMDRLSQEIEQLATFSAAPPPSVTRVLYSAEDQAARIWLRELVQRAGLRLREDGLGNLFARWDGSEPDLPAVGTGSHCDAIPFSGKFDGVVGVLGGVEALRALQRAGVKPKRSLEVVMFTAEEPTRFGIGCLGSRAMAGTISPAALLELQDAEGNRLDDLRRAAGFCDDLSEVRLVDNYYHAFIELHIEQGPRLEREDLQIGIVTSIAAPATLRVVLHGDGGHAGATLMPGRRDALVAAAQIVQDVERAGLDSGSPDSVATVGLLEVHPGAVNSIPSTVTMEIDIRDTGLETRDGMVEQIRQAILSIGRLRKIETDIEILNADAPCQSSRRIVEVAESVTRERGYRYKKMPSRAYHDTLFMAQICPTAMLFVPSENGYSHRPEEYTSAAEIGQGVEVLALTMAKLAEL